MPLRFTARLLATAAACGALGYALGSAADNAPGARRIPVVATRFTFSASELRVRRGEPVTLVLSTPDFVHGFSVPDLNARVDLIPGRTVELALKPDRSGRFVFLCDNFCGDGHDKMTGFIVVTDD